MVGIAAGVTAVLLAGSLAFAQVPTPRPRPPVDEAAGSTALAQLPIPRPRPAIDEATQARLRKDAQLQRSLRTTEARYMALHIRHHGSAAVLGENGGKPQE